MSSSAYKNIQSKLFNLMRGAYEKTCLKYDYNRKRYDNENDSRECQSHHTPHKQ